MRQRLAAVLVVSRLFGRLALTQRLIAATLIAGLAMGTPVMGTSGNVPAPLRASAQERPTIREPRASRPPLPEPVQEERANKPAPPVPEGPVNKVRKRTPDQVRQVEASSNGRVVVNEDRVFAFEFGDPGNRTMIANLDIKTPGGADVIGLVFMNEEQIQQLEAHMESSAISNSVLGPRIANAHWDWWDHVHEFWTCSGVYQYAESYAIDVFLCGPDVGFIQYVGSAIATAIGHVPFTPLLKWVPGVAFYGGVWNFQNPDGSVEFYVDGEAVLNAWGWAYWYTYDD